MTPATRRHLGAAMTHLLEAGFEDRSDPDYGAFVEQLAGVEAVLKKLLLRRA